MELLNEIWHNSYPSAQIQRFGFVTISMLPLDWVGYCFLHWKSIDLTFLFQSWILLIIIVWVVRSTSECLACSRLQSEKLSAWRSREECWPESQKRAMGSHLKKKMKTWNSIAVQGEAFIRIFTIIICYYYFCIRQLFMYCYTLIKVS